MPGRQPPSEGFVRVDLVPDGKGICFLCYGAPVLLRCTYESERIVFRKVDYCERCIEMLGNVKASGKFAVMELPPSVMEQIARTVLARRTKGDAS